MKQLILIIMLGGIFGCGSKKPNQEKIKAKILNKILKLNLETDLDIIEKHLLPHIYLDLPIKSEDKIKLSKLGGKPNLPESIEWPNFDNKPMVFLGQFSFSELKSYDINNELPDSGMVFYFIYFKKPENEFGAEYNFLIDKNEYRVIYSNKTGQKHRDFPVKLPEEYKFKEQKFSFKLGYSLPARESIQREDFNLNDEDLIEDFNYEHGTIEGEQILGYCMPIQGDISWDWAFSFLNYKKFDLTEEDKKEILDTSSEFINLFQFSLDNNFTGFDKIGISMGYFGIRKQDLKKKDFDKSILVFQDT